MATSTIGFNVMTDCPYLLPALVMGNEPRLLAKIASVLAQQRFYLPLVEGPRMKRIDADIEISRRQNLAARLQPKSFFFAGLEPDARSQFSGRFPKKRCFDVEEVGDLRRRDHGLRMRQRKVLTWGPNQIGVGLHRALCEKRQIEFCDHDVPIVHSTRRSANLVACEDGDDFAQVLAANYAYSIGADFRLIPQILEEEPDELLERFYTLYDDSHTPPSDALLELRNEVRARAGDLAVEGYACVTFISREFPWGFGFPEVPSAHIFKYPDLGIALANAVAAEQPNAPGIRVAAVVDPSAADESEVVFTAKHLAGEGTLVRGYRGPSATVRDVSHMVELLPYDFLLLATHCGDASGWRFTYEYVDREGIPRNLVVDTAIGVAYEPGQDKFPVMQFIKFVSLDGVDWSDRAAKAKHYVGMAIRDYVERDRDQGGMQPSKREQIPRVRWSAALKMHDDNFILPPAQLADYGTPIVLNNACGSWHRLASTFTYGNARAYIGTLFPVNNVEAEEVVKGLVGSHFGRPLAVALWETQRDVYEGDRRPYLFVGPHFQRLRSNGVDALEFLARRLTRARSALEGALDMHRSPNASPTNEQRAIESRIRFLNFELAGLRASSPLQRSP